MQKKLCKRILLFEKDDSYRKSERIYYGEYR